MSVAPNIRDLSQMSDEELAFTIRHYRKKLQLLEQASI